MSQSSIWNILVVVAAALLLIGNAAIWVNRDLADTDRFVETAVTELEKQEAREAIAAEIVFTIMANQPRIYEIAGPGAERAVTQLLGTPAFQGLLTLIATNLHQIVVHGNRPTITIGPAFLPPIVAAIIIAVGPAGILSFQDQQLVIDPLARQDIPSLERFIDPLRKVGLLCGVAGIVILALSVVVADNRPRALRRAAIALVTILAITVIAIFPLRSLYLARIDNETAHTITESVLATFTTQLIVQSLIVFLIPAAILFAVSLVWQRDAGRGTRDAGLERA